MGLVDDLAAEVVATFTTDWESRDGRQVPEPEDIQLGNDAVRLTGTVLYADLAESTKLVDTYPPEFAAAVYKAYLHCASRLIRNAGGSITAFDGDRVMAVFHGTTKNTSAALCALWLNWAVSHVLNPILKHLFPKIDYAIAHGVGVDVSKLFVARTGVRGDNDLVWVGRAANCAAKLSALRESGYPLLITGDVHDNMLPQAQKWLGKAMWEWDYWPAKNNLVVYKSDWWMRPS